MVSWWHNRTSKILVRILSLSVSSVFLFTQVVGASVPDRSFWANRQKSKDKLLACREKSYSKDTQKGLGERLEEKDVAGEVSSLITPHNLFTVPSQYGTVKEVHTQASGDKGQEMGSRLIIHIQDAHSSPDAQLNSANIIRYLEKDVAAEANSPLLICVEGSSGLVDTTLLSSFPEKKIKEEVANDFLKEGKITGEEYVAITKEEKAPSINIYGVEDKRAYEKNLKAFEEGLSSGEELRNYFQKIQKEINPLKAHLYNNRLKDLESKIEAYQKKKIPLIEYCQYLYGLSDVRATFMAPDDAPLPSGERVGVRGKYPNFELFVQASEFEDKIDFSMVDSERTKYIKELSEKLTNDELSDLLIMSLDYRLGKVTSGEYYTYLQALSSRMGKGVRAEDPRILTELVTSKEGKEEYPNLNLYIKYNKLYDRMDQNKLFSEISELDQELKERLCETEEERKLVKLSRMLDVLEDLANLKISNEDLAYYYKHHDEINPEMFSPSPLPLPLGERIKGEGRNVGATRSLPPMYRGGRPVGTAQSPSPILVKADLSTFEEFYRIALTRNQALVDNTLSRMEKEGVKVAILIAGGFHTPGITGLLRDRSISYVVVTPRLGENDSPDLEISPRKKRTDLEKAIAGIVGALRPASLLAEQSFQTYSVIQLGGRTLIFQRAFAELRKKWIEGIDARAETRQVIENIDFLPKVLARGDELFVLGVIRGTNSRTLPFVLRYDAVQKKVSEVISGENECKKFMLPSSFDNRGELDSTVSGKLQELWPFLVSEKGISVPAREASGRVASTKPERIKFPTWARISHRGASLNAAFGNIGEKLHRVVGGLNDLIASLFKNKKDVSRKFTGDKSRSAMRKRVNEFLNRLEYDSLSRTQKEKLKGSGIRDREEFNKRKSDIKNRLSIIYLDSGKNLFWVKGKYGAAHYGRKKRNVYVSAGYATRASPDQIYEAVTHDVLHILGFTHRQALNIAKKNNISYDAQELMDKLGREDKKSDFGTKEQGTIAGVLISRQNMERYERGRLVMQWAAEASGKTYADLPLIGNEISLNDLAKQSGAPIEVLVARVNIGRRPQADERWWEEKVGPVAMILDYDNTSAPGDAPLSDVPESLNAYLQLLEIGIRIIVPTGGDYNTIEKNLIIPLREALNKRNKIRLLQQVVLVHDKGAGVSGFGKNGERIKIKQPGLFPQQDRNNMARELINTFFDTLEKTVPSLQTADWQKKIGNSRSFALEQLEKESQLGEWINANSEAPHKLHIIPPEYRDEQSGFGDIFIWNRGGMFVLELDYVNKNLKIGNYTGEVMDKVRNKLGDTSSDGESIYYDYGLTYAEFSKALKGKAVKEQFEKFIKPWFDTNRRKGRPLLLAVDDSRGGFDVFQQFFGSDVNFIRIYVGIKSDEIVDLEAATRQSSVFRRKEKGNTILLSELLAGMRSLTKRARIFIVGIYMAIMGTNVVGGLLFDPGNVISEREKVSYRPAVSEQTRRARRYLEEAKKLGQPLTIKAHLRGLDGPGSSLDLPEFQRTLTEKGAKLLVEIPSTLTFASEFATKIRFEILDDPDVVEYIAPDYGITKDKPYRVSNKVRLVEDPNRPGAMVTPHGMKDAPAYIFANLFGIRGVRIICEEISPMARAGGMESSNAFMVALLAAASMLSGRNLTWAEIFREAVRLENQEFRGLTGGQGHLASILGGVYRHIWQSGKRDKKGELINPYGAFSIPVEVDKEGIESHMALVQAGKKYRDGKPEIARTAELINTMWTDLLRDRDEIGYPLHKEKIGLTARYNKALMEGDWEEVVRVVNRYVEIRDEICKRWLDLAIKGVKKGEIPEYAQKYVKRFKEDEVLQQFYRKHGDKLAEISLYTYEPISNLVEAARRDGHIAIMPLGAGGPGANLIAISSKGKEHLREFLEGNELPEFTDEAKIGQIMTGPGENVLKGWIPFRIGTEPIKLEGFGKVRLEEPQMPNKVGYNQKTGKFVEGGRSKYSGLLFDPGYVISKRDGVSHRPAVSEETKRSMGYLGQARKDGKPITITAHLRGLDGPGSSLDLPEFQKSLTEKGARFLVEIPSTLTFASEFAAKIRFELLEDGDVVEYVAPDYGITEDNPYRVRNKVRLIEDPNRPGVMVTPHGMKDAPAYIFANLFGIRGVRIICEEVSPMALAGGMESSNAFMVALLAAASMLSGRNLTWAEIFREAVRLENQEFRGLTGGQGHLASILGGIFRHIWQSGKKDAEGNLINPYGAFSIPVDVNKEGIESHMALVQAGKKYRDGKPEIARTAELINTMWTDLLRDRDEIGYPLHKEKIGLTARYNKALMEGDWEEVVRVVNRYVEIRDEICKRWLDLAIRATKGEEVPEYAHKYARRFKEDEVLQQFYRKHGDKLSEISLYTYEPISNLVEAARRDGHIAIMPLGAGGPGANLIAISSKGKEHLRGFLEGNRLSEFTDESEIRQVMTGPGENILRGWIPFKIGTEPITLKGFEGLEEPAQPTQVNYNQRKSKFQEKNPRKRAASVLRRMEKGGFGERPLNTYLRTIPPASESPVKLVIFDWGQVLERFDYMRAARKLAKRFGIDENVAYGFYEGRNSDPENPLYQYEHGKKGVGEKKLRQEMSKWLTKVRGEETELTEKDLHEIFASWVRIGDIPEALSLLRNLREKGYKVRILTTTSKLYHQFRLKHTKVVQLLEHGEMDIYASYLTGLFKPDERSFLKVTTDNWLYPRQTLFIDDKQDCVDGARKAGLKTLQFNPQDVLGSIKDIASSLSSAKGTAGSSSGIKGSAKEILKPSDSPIIFSVTSIPIREVKLSDDIRLQNLLKEHGFNYSSFIPHRGSGLTIWKDRHNQEFILKPDTSKDALAYYLAQVVGFTDIGKVLLFIVPDAVFASGLRSYGLIEYYDGTVFSAREPSARIQVDSELYAQHPELRDLTPENINFDAWFKVLADPGQIVRSDLFRILTNNVDPIFPSNVLYKDLGKGKADIRFVDYSIAFDAYLGPDKKQVISHLKKYAPYYLKYCPELLMNIVNLSNEDIEHIVRWVYRRELLNVRVGVDNPEELIRSIISSRDLIKEALSDEITAFETRSKTRLARAVATTPMGEVARIVEEHSIQDLASFGVSIAVSLGGTKIGCAAVNPAGDIFARVSDMKTPVESEDKLFKAIWSQIEAVVEKVGFEKVVGIGVSSPGPLNPETGVIIFTENIPFKNFPLKARLESLFVERFGRPVYAKVFHDADARAKGEASPKGTLPGCKNMMFLNWGTGIGDGVIRDGEVYWNDPVVGTMIGEIGWTVTRTKDGKYRHYHSMKDRYPAPRELEKGEVYFEHYLGGPALIQRMRQQISQSGANGKALLKIVNKRTVEDLELKDINEAARASDELAIELIEQAGIELGRGLAAFIRYWKLERGEEFTDNVVIGAGVAKIGNGVVKTDATGKEIPVLPGAIKEGLRREMGGKLSDSMNVVISKMVMSEFDYDGELLAFAPKIEDFVSNLPDEGATTPLPITDFGKAREILEQILNKNGIELPEGVSSGELLSMLYFADQKGHVPIIALDQGTLVVWANPDANKENPSQEDINAGTLLRFTIVYHLGKRLREKGRNVGFLLDRPALESLNDKGSEEGRVSYLIEMGTLPKDFREVVKDVPLVAQMEETRGKRGLIPREGKLNVYDMYPAGRRDGFTVKEAMELGATMIKSNVFFYCGPKLTVYEEEFNERQWQFIEELAKECRENNIGYVSELLFMVPVSKKAEEKEYTTTKEYMEAHAKATIEAAKRMKKIEGITLQKLAHPYPGEAAMTAISEPEREAKLKELSEIVPGRWLILSAAEGWDTFHKKVLEATKYGQVTGMLVGRSPIKGITQKVTDSKGKQADVIKSYGEVVKVLQVEAIEKELTLLGYIDNAPASVWQGLGFSKDGAKEMREVREELRTALEKTPPSLRRRLWLSVRNQLYRKEGGFARILPGGETEGEKGETPSMAAGQTKQKATASLLVDKARENLSGKNNVLMRVYLDRQKLGRAEAGEVAREIRRLIKEKGKAVVVLAAAPSQNEFLDELANQKGIDWSKVVFFHLDDYVDLPRGHKNSFEYYLNEQFFDKLKAKPKVYFIKELAGKDEEVSEKYSQLILDEGGIDIACIGVGENGHIAFNDPGSLFFINNLVDVVTMDERCRRQQLRDYANHPDPERRYKSLNEVPRRAFTLTIPAILSANKIFCSVPADSKKYAVRSTILGPVTHATPASLLKRHKSARFYFDRDSASLLGVDFKGDRTYTLRIPAQPRLGDIDFTESVRTVLLPRNERVAVIDYNGEADASSYGLMRRLEGQGNEIRVYHVDSSLKDLKHVLRRLWAFNPEYVLVPHEADGRRNVKILYGQVVPIVQLLTDNNNSLKTLFAYETKGSALNYNLIHILKEKTYEKKALAANAPQSQLKRSRFDITMEAGMSANMARLNSLGLIPEVDELVSIGVLPRGEEPEFAELFNITYFVNGEERRPKGRFLFGAEKSTDKLYPLDIRDARVEALFAHCDDETSSAGLLTELAARGCDIDPIYLTTGHRAVILDKKGRVIKDKDRKIAIRQNEASEAIRRVGIEYEPTFLALSFYDNVDENGECIISDGDRVQLYEEVKIGYNWQRKRGKNGPFVIMVNEEKDHHRDHRAAYEIATWVARKLSQEENAEIAVIYSPGVWFDESNLFNYLADDIVDEKLASLGDAHLKRVSLFSGPSNAIVAPEMASKEGFGAVPVKPEHLGGGSAERFDMIEIIPNAEPFRQKDVAILTETPARPIQAKRPPHEERGRFGPKLGKSPRSEEPKEQIDSGATFGENVKFLKETLGGDNVVVLSDKSEKAQLVVVPAYQGRVMTSSADGQKGLSFGWINRKQIERMVSGEIDRQINVAGGEDRFWMGPEGGQFSIFFPKGTSPEFKFQDWQTPAVIDTEPFDVVDKSQDSVSFRKQTHLTNFSGTAFDVQIDRTVRLLSRDDARNKLGLNQLPGDLKVVAYESENKITNIGKKAWSKATGLLSVWILGMYNPSPSTTVVIPFKRGPEKEMGPTVNDAYFGKVPADRLVVKEDTLFFSGDGQHRSKIGLSPERAKPILGSYDAANNVLTLVQYTKPRGARDYVNSMWEIQESPYRGDVVNSYNDGPVAPGGKPLGPFYELETSSPGKELRPNQSVSHIHRTIHLQGPEELLDKIARQTLGVGLEEVKNALKSPRGRTAQPRDEKSGRFKERPGKSPEDAKKIIALSPHIQGILSEQGWFTLLDYRTGYKEVAGELGFEPLAENWEATVRIDLERLDLDFLTIDRTERLCKYRVTDQGKAEIAKIQKSYETRKLSEALIERYRLLVNKVCDRSVDANGVYNRAYLIVLTVLAAYLAEQRGELTEKLIEQFRKSLIEDLEKAQKDEPEQIRKALETLHTIGLHRDNPEKSIANGLCKMVELAAQMADRENYAMVELTTSGPSKESLLNKYHRLAVSLLSDKVNERQFSTRAIQLADFVMEAYYWNEKLELVSEAQKARSVQDLLIALKNTSKQRDAGKRDISGAKKILIEEICLKTGIKEGDSIINQLWGMLDLALDGQDPAQVLLHSKDFEKWVRVQRKVRRIVALHIIFEEFTAADLAYLIKEMEAPSFKGRVEEANKPLLYLLLRRLKCILDKIGVRNRLPGKFPSNYAIGGSEMLKQALALRELAEEMSLSKKPVEREPTTQRHDEKGWFTPKPGKSPEDAKKLIASSEYLQEVLRNQGWFNLEHYGVAYEWEADKLGFDPLAKNWERTARRDLEALAQEGFLTIDESGKVWLTTEGHREIIAIRELVALAESIARAKVVLDLEEEEDSKHTHELELERDLQPSFDNLLNGINNVGTLQVSLEILEVKRRGTEERMSSYLGDIIERIRQRIQLLPAENCNSPSEDSKAPLTEGRVARIEAVTTVQVYEALKALIETVKPRGPVTVTEMAEMLRISEGITSLSVDGKHIELMSWKARNAVRLILEEMGLAKSPPGNLTRNQVKVNSLPDNQKPFEICLETGRDGSPEVFHLPQGDYYTLKLTADIVAILISFSFLFDYGFFASVVSENEVRLNYKDRETILATPPTLGGLTKAFDELLGEPESKPTPGMPGQKGQGNGHTFRSFLPAILAVILGLASTGWTKEIGRNMSKEIPGVFAQLGKEATPEAIYATLMSLVIGILVGVGVGFILAMYARRDRKVSPARNGLFAVGILSGGFVLLVALGQFKLMAFAGLLSGYILTGSIMFFRQRYQIKEKQALELIKEKFSPDELEHLVEQMQRPTFTGRVTSEKAPETYRLLVWLKNVLEKIGVRNRLPGRLQRRKQIGGLRMLQQALIESGEVAERKSMPEQEKPERPYRQTRLGKGGLPLIFGLIALLGMNTASGMHALSNWVGRITVNLQQAGFGLGFLGILAFTVTGIGAWALYRQVGVGRSSLMGAERVGLSEALGLRTLEQAMESLIGQVRRVVAPGVSQSSKSEQLRTSWANLLIQPELSREEISRIRALAEKLKKGDIARFWTTRGPFFANPEINSWLGWSYPGQEPAGKVGKIEEFAESVRKDYEYVVVIGKGVPYAKVTAAIGESRGYPKVIAVEATHPEAVREIESKINLEKTLFVVSSPVMGEGYEAYNYFYGELAQFYKAQGVSAEEILSEVGKHFVGIGEANRQFVKEAREREFLRVFSEEAGVSRSVFSYEGLVPLALAGVNIEKFVESGKRGREICREENLEENPGMQLALFQEKMRESGREIFIVLPEGLEGFGEAMEELAESLWGEEGKIIPIAEGKLSHPESYGEKAAFITIRMAGTLKSARPVVGGSPFGVTAESKEAGYPVFELPLRGKEEIGGLFYAGEFATALSYLMRIDRLRRSVGVEELLSAKAASYELEMVSAAGAIGLEMEKGEQLPCDVSPEDLKYEETKALVVDFDSLFDIERVEEANPWGMRIEFRVKPRSRAAFSVMGNIVKAAQEAGNPHGVKFAFVSSRRNLSAEVMEEMVRDYMSGYGLGTDVIFRVIDSNLIIDREQLEANRGIVGITESAKISTKAVFSIINERLLLSGSSDGNGTQISIITDSASRWKMDGTRKMMERILLVLLEPAKKGEMLSTAAGLVVAIEGKVSDWLIKFIRSRYPEAEAERVLSEIVRDGKIILPAMRVDEKYLEGIESEARIYEIQA